MCAVIEIENESKNVDHATGDVTDQNAIDEVSEDCEKYEDIVRDEVFSLILI